MKLAGSGVGIIKIARTRISTMLAILVTLAWFSGLHVHSACLSRCHDLIIEAFACGHDVGICATDEDDHACEAEYDVTQDPAWSVSVKRTPAPAGVASILSPGRGCTPVKLVAGIRVRDDVLPVSFRLARAARPRSPPVSPITKLI